MLSGGTLLERADALATTVGKIDAAPGAINVIPGMARFSVDLRSADDALREAAIADLAAEFRAIAARRAVALEIRGMQSSPAAGCAPWLMDRLGAAVRAEGVRELRLMSGAGHDGMAMIRIADIGMLFVRCAGGISHHPAEAVTAADAEAGARVLLRFIRAFRPEGRPR